MNAMQVTSLKMNRRALGTLLLVALAWGVVTAGPPCYGCAPVVVLDPCWRC